MNALDRFPWKAAFQAEADADRLAAAVREGKDKAIAEALRLHDEAVAQR